MATLAEILAQCRDHIGDTSVAAPTFSDATLTDFINRAIGDLNAHFPRRAAYTVSAGAGEHSYALENAHQHILAVEYPAGRTPPCYLQRRACADPAFWLADGYYDFLASNDAGSLNPPRLVISATPRAGESIRLEVTAEHNPLLDSNDTTSIPDRFLHLIALFVRWKTWESLASQEGMDPNPLKGLTGVHGLNAARSETAYRAALAAAKAAFSESAAAVWEFPGQGRIY